MRRALVLALPLAAIFACRAASELEDPPPRPPDDAGVDAANDVAVIDAPTNDAPLDAPVDGGTPSVLYVGRWDTTSTPKAAWPGSRIVARFTGTAVSGTFSQTAGSDGNGTYVNVIVDDGTPTSLQITGTNTALSLASGLTAGTHTIEVEKRTEANFGTLTFHGFTFAGGALLPPPARKTRRIEFLSDSTIDGYGVEGNRNTTCAGFTAPPQFNNARKSLAYYTAKTLDAEHHLIAASGKGIARNENGDTIELFPALFGRTLPETTTSTWTFASWVPDVVVISLGGSDFAPPGGASVTLPADFQTKYSALVADVRARYGAGPVILMTVWSQIKDYNDARPELTAALDAIDDPGTKLHRFSFTESPDVDANETGCQFHANDAHHQAMAAELVTQIKARTGWQ